MKSTINLRDNSAKQLELFETEIEVEKLPKLVRKKKPESLNDNGSAFSDPAFASNKSLPVHRWVPWIAGFSSDFVKHALTSYLNSKSVVLDPFAGVGTTLVESVATGHNAIGFEINPYPALACHIKLDAHFIDVNVLKKEILRFEIFYRDRASSGYNPASVPPKGFKTRAAFYSPGVLCKVLIIQDFISAIENINIQNLFKLAFAATMVRYSNYSYEPSQARRVSSGKSEIQDFPVMETIRSKLVEMEEDIVWLQGRLSREPLKLSVINDSFVTTQDPLSQEGES